MLVALSHQPSHADTQLCSLLFSQYLDRTYQIQTPTVVHHCSSFSLFLANCGPISKFTSLAKVLERVAGPSSVVIMDGNDF